MKVTVELDGKEYVSVYDIAKVATPFEKGDFVRYIGSPSVPAGHGPRPGACGKVVAVGKNTVSVEFAEFFSAGHWLDGETSRGHGWYFYSDSDSRNRPGQSTGELEKIP